MTRKTMTFHDVKHWPMALTRLAELEARARNQGSPGEARAIGLVRRRLVRHRNRLLLMERGTWAD